MRFDKFKIIAEEIERHLKNIQTEWDGKQSIQEMKETRFKQWKQMEWTGFYFEYKVNKLLDTLNFSSQKNIVTIGKVSFDGFYKIPWDVKTHVANNTSNTSEVIVNDKQAILATIEKYECLGLIVGIGKAIYNDVDGSFKMWHAALKGDISDYVKEGEKRGRKSRKRKVHYSLNQIAFIKLDKELIVSSGEFQEGFRNSNGSLRPVKVKLYLSKLEEGVNVYYCKT